MANFMIIPTWFLGYNIILEAVFALITLIVSRYAFKLYKLSEQRQLMLFGMAFLSISISYFIQSLLNFAILFNLTEDICHMVKANNLNSLNFIGVYTYVIFFTFGLMLLFFMTLRIKDAKIFSLIFLIVLSAIFLSANILFMFYLVSSIMLLSVCLHYLKNYLDKKQTKTLLVLIAFVFLLFGRVHFIFALNHGTYYVLGHVLELGAYGLILINLLRVLSKNEQKTR